MRWSGHYKHDDNYPQLHHDWQSHPDFPSTSTERTFRQMPEAQSEDWVRKSGKYRVQMFMEPARPKVGNEVSISFEITDPSSRSIVSVSGALMACTARMPNVPGHIHVMETHTQHPEIKPGLYQMHPIHFEMGGRWDWVLQVQTPDRYEFFAVFPVDVEGPPWPPNFMPEELKKPQSSQRARELKR